MSTAQMSKMLIQQGLTVGMSEKGLNDAQKQELSAMKQEEAQVKITKSIEKMQQAFAPIVEIVADVLGGTLGMLSNMKLLKPIVIAIGAAFAISKISKLVSGASAFKDNLKGGLGILKDIGKKTLSAAKSIIPQKFGGTKGASKVSSTAGEGMDKAGESIGKSADKTKDVKGNKGEDIKKFIIGVVDGLKYAGENFGMVVAGGAALLLSTPGLIGLGIASPGLFIISKIN